MALTRSKAAARQKVTETEEDLVTINWIFFDKFDPEECMPLSIDVPRAHFNNRLQNCRQLFANEILDSLSRSVRQNTVKFWKVGGIHYSCAGCTNKGQPKELTLVDTVMEEGWKEEINDIKDLFNLLPYTRSFAKVLGRDIENDDAVHLAVTATAFSAEEHIEGDDLANELPEIRRTSYRLLLFQF
jgi:hypothetical protein